MGHNSGVNSTEKLLDAIRGNRAYVEEKPRVSETSKQMMPVNRAIKKNMCAGVVVDPNFISLVLTGGGGVFKELVKWAQVPIPDHIDIEHERFSSFLSTTVSDFLRGYKKVDIWSAIDSKDFKIRNLTIPELPASKVSNAVYWSFKKDVNIDLSKEMFDFQDLGMVQQSGVQKRNVLAFSGLKSEINSLKYSFANANYPLKGITSTSFALQNFARVGLLVAEEGPIVVVNVGRYQTEITCIYKSSVQFVRTIRTGSHSLVEDLFEMDDSPVKDRHDILDILSSGFDRDHTIFTHMEPAAERLVGKVLRTGDFCSQKFASNEPVEKYLFFGETDNCNAFMDYAAERIPVEAKCFDPYSGVSLKPDSISLPEGARERSGIIPALGLSLSVSDVTPDFLYTYVQRDSQAKYKKINISIVSLCLLSLLACSIGWWWQNLIVNEGIAEKNRIEKNISSYLPMVSEESLDLEIERAKERVTAITEYGNAYLPLAVISEICEITPENITLDSLKSNLQNMEAVKVNTSSNEKDSRRSIIITGSVDADFTSLEATLTGYVIKLEDSPLFGDIMILKKTIKTTETVSVLTFTADMEVL